MPSDLLEYGQGQGVLPTLTRPLTRTSSTTPNGGAAMQSTQRTRATCQHPDGCNRPVKAFGWCRPHHERIKRSGTPGPATIGKWRPSDRECRIEGCQASVGHKGGLDLCMKHYQRYRKHGDPLVVKKGGACLPLDKNPNWSGDQASYAAVHLRLPRQRGVAADRACIDCCRPAAHWSFSGRVSDDLRHENGLAYSVNLADYQPRCVPCHSAHDRRLRAAESGVRP